MIELWVGIAILAAVGKTSFYSYQTHLTDDYDSLELSFFTTAVAVLFLLPVAGWSVWANGIPNAPVQDWGVVVGLGVVNAAGYGLYLHTLSITGISVASPVKQTKTIVIAIAEPLLFVSVVYQPPIIIAALAAALGGYFVLLDDTGPLTPFRRITDTGPKLAFLTMLIYAVSSLGTRFGATTLPPIIYGTITMSVMAVCFAFGLWKQGRTPGSRSLFRRKMVVAGGLNASKNVLTWVAYSMAVATKVTTITQLTVLLNVLVGGAILKESHFGKRLVGAALILVGSGIILYI